MNIKLLKYMKLYCIQLQYTYIYIIIYKLGNSII